MAAYYILLVATYHEIQIIAFQIIEISLLCITQRYCIKFFSKWVSAESFIFGELSKDKDLRALILLLLYFTHFSHSSRGDEGNVPHSVIKHGTFPGLDRKDMAYFTFCSCIICFILKNFVLSLGTA